MHIGAVGEYAYTNMHNFQFVYRVVRDIFDKLQENVLEVISNKNAQ